MAEIVPGLPYAVKAEAARLGISRFGLHVFSRVDNERFCPPTPEFMSATK